MVMSKQQIAFYQKKMAENPKLHSSKIPTPQPRQVPASIVRAAPVFRPIIRPTIIQSRPIIIQQAPPRRIPVAKAPPPPPKPKPPPRPKPKPKPKPRPKPPAPKSPPKLIVKKEQSLFSNMQTNIKKYPLLYLGGLALLAALFLRRD